MRKTREKRKKMRSNGRRSSVGWREGMTGPASRAHAHAVTTRKSGLGIRSHPSLAGREIKRDQYQTLYQQYVYIQCERKEGREEERWGGVGWPGRRQWEGIQIYIHAHYTHRDRSCQDPDQLYVFAAVWTEEEIFEASAASFWVNTATKAAVSR